MNAIARAVAENANLDKLLDGDQALLAAMVYVDLNPVRAGVASSVEGSDHTGVQHRNSELRTNHERANRLLLPIAGFGVLSSKEIAGRLAMNNRQYIELVDYTGRQKRKRGQISETEPPALRRLPKFDIRGAFLPTF